VLGFGPIQNRAILSLFGVERAPCFSLDPLIHFLAKGFERRSAWADGLDLVLHNAQLQNVWLPMRWQVRPFE
jgi:hypothetical protein